MVNSNSEEDGVHTHISLHDFYWQVKIARRPILHGLGNSSRSGRRQRVIRTSMWGVILFCFFFFWEVTFLGLGHKSS